MKTLPHTLRVVKHYANARPTERNWRTIVLGLFLKYILPPGAEVPEKPVFGVSSKEQLEDILSQFRRTLHRLLDFASLNRAEAIELCEILTSKANLELEGVTIDPRTGLLTPVWRTGKESFSEMLYGFLLLALQEVPLSHLHWCASCAKFFLDASRRHTKFCSARCCNRELVRRYRKRHPEKYREYQRELMRKRH